MAIAKVRAYVSRECCGQRLAYPPGTCIRGDEPIHRHGDYVAWRYGKRETLYIMQHHTSPYERATARQVALLYRWIQEND